MVQAVLTLVNHVIVVMNVQQIFLFLLQHMSITTTALLAALLALGLLALATTWVALQD